MNGLFLKAGAILATLAVAIGAFGAHLFKPYLVSISKLDTFETAVHYQFYGAFGLLIIGLLSGTYPNKFNNFAGYFILFGTLIFSGALYLICATANNIFGAIAPIGGIGLILGWSFMFLSIKK